MTNILYDLTGKIDKNTVAILSEINRIADKRGLAYFIVGATARDILLQHAHDIHSMRATVDVDIGVLVSVWNEFQSLKQALVDTGKFNSTRQAQRLMYKDEFPVNILEREAGLSQGHRIAMDVLRGDKFQLESYEKIVEHFSALLRGLSES